MKISLKRNAVWLSVAVAAFSNSLPVAHAQDTVNIYSYRQAGLLQPLLDDFTAKTGIRTRVLFASKGLDQRIASEGANSPADILMTVDIGRLSAAANLGITQAVKDPAINDNIPSQFRDADGQWFGLTSRARVVYASRDRVSQDAITYEDLADPKWKGRICTRSGQHSYTLGLIASMIAHHGEADAEKWLTGLKNNLARKPTGNDRAQVKAIYSGECDLALGNTYYMGLMQTNEKEPQQKDWAAAVKLLFPNAEGRGTHVNLSGMVMAKHAPNPEAARKFMAYLASEQAQQIYAKSNFEYPLKPGVNADAVVSSWGNLNSDKLPLADVAKLRKAASEMVDRVGFDEGPDA